MEAMLCNVLGEDFIYFNLWLQSCEDNEPDFDYAILHIGLASLAFELIDEEKNDEDLKKLFENVMIFNEIIKV